VDFKELDVSNRNLADDYYGVIGCGLPPVCSLTKLQTGTTKQKIFGINVNVPFVKTVPNQACINQHNAHNACVAKQGHLGQNIIKDVQQNINKDLKAVFLTYNPALAIPRSSALLAFRVNLFGVSSRLYPAFLDDASLTKYNFDKENAKNAKIAWEKVANFWEDKIGGDRNKLKEAISGAWNKPIFKTKIAKQRKASTSTFTGYSNVSGYDDLAIAAYISAGMSVIGGVVKMISDNKVKKNPYNNGSTQAQDFNNQLQQGGTPPDVNQAELDTLAKLAVADRAKGLDSTGLDASDVNASTIAGIPSTTFWIGLAVVVSLIGGYLLLRKNK
jgi:hypothetical protein